MDLTALVEKALSRKLAVGLVGAVAPILIQAVTGQIGWKEAAGLSTAAVVSYVLGQAHVDAAKHRGPSKP